MAEPVERVEHFQELILKLQENEIVNTDIIDLLEHCNFPMNEWSRYAFYNNSICCSRNLVYELPKQFRLVLNCWSPRRENQIHNHSTSDCYFKVLRGTVREKQFTDTLVERIDKTYDVGEVRHLGSLPGLHCMENCDTSLVAVTLHVYVPPFDTYSTVEGGVRQQETFTFVSRFGYANNSSIRRL